jgi:hypothetical protein
MVFIFEFRLNTTETLQRPEKDGGYHYKGLVDEGPTLQMFNNRREKKNLKNTCKRIYGSTVQYYELLYCVEQLIHPNIYKNQPTGRRDN